MVFLANILAILSRRMVGGVTCHLFVRQEIEERLWWGEPEEETSSKAQTHIKDEGCNGCHGIRMKSVGWIGVPEDKEGDTGSVCLRIRRGYWIGVPEDKEGDTG